VADHFVRPREYSAAVGRRDPREAHAAIRQHREIDQPSSPNDVGVRIDQVRS
jgi:hypothetical protein